MYEMSDRKHLFKDILKLAAIVVAPLFLIQIIAGVAAMNTHEPADYSRFVIDAPAQAAHEPAEPKVEIKTKCTAQISYDYNWDNDYLCQQADGTSYQTGYDKAAKYLGN